MRKRIILAAMAAVAVIAFAQPARRGLSSLPLV
jgi:hypothetical protein